MILHSVDYGPKDAGQSVVFLGSIASTSDMWLPQLDTLSHNHRVIALDHRGHGRSADPQVTPGNSTFDDLTTDVLETLDSINVNNFAVVGLSLGGAIAQYLAATSNRVTKAAFLCTAAYFGGPNKWLPRAELTRAQGLAPMVDNIVNLWFTEQFRSANPATIDDYRRMILTTRGTGYASCSDALATWDFRNRLNDITVPVLTLAGDQDQSTPPPALEEIAAGVSGPVTKVVVSPGAHVPTIEVPDQVNQALAKFLA